jgi:hypothetical protein
MTNQQGIRNWGYDPTCSGWVVRDGTEHVATFRREADADEYVRLLLAYIRAPEPRAYMTGTPPTGELPMALGVPVEPSRECEATFERSYEMALERLALASKYIPLDKHDAYEADWKLVRDALHVSRGKQVSDRNSHRND